VLDWTDPPYPEQARQQGVEGTVVLQLTVGADGSPGHVRVSRSSGHAALDEAAIAHVRRARFSPALKDGKAVPMPMTFRVKFHLVNA
jgi:protein TonB